jgi:hypothetical protein
MSLSAVIAIRRSCRSILASGGNHFMHSRFIGSLFVGGLARTGQESLNELSYGLKAPEVSETNLYDALINVIGRMKSVAGRKAIILISTGVDTFSRAKLEDVLAACRDAVTPIYVIGVRAILRLTDSVDMARCPRVRRHHRAVLPQWTVPALDCQSLLTAAEDSSFSTICPHTRPASRGV